MVEPASPHRPPSQRTSRAANAPASASRRPGHADVPSFGEIGSRSYPGRALGARSDRFSAPPLPSTGAHPEALPRPAIRAVLRARTSQPWCARPTTSSRRRSPTSSWRVRPPTPCAWSCPAPNPAGTTTRATGQRRARSPNGARTASWSRSAQPSLYIHEMRWPEGGLRSEGRARGVLTRLRLEPFGPDSGVRPHERTMSGPKEDRFRLLKATGVNLSPVVLLADGDPSTTDTLDRMTARDPDLVATTDDGVSHRALDRAGRAGRGRGRPSARAPSCCVDLGARAADHRRRPPSIRDGAPVSRGARHAPGMRERPRVGLRAGTGL